MGIERDNNWLERVTEPKKKRPAAAGVHVDPAELDDVVRAMSEPGETGKKIRDDLHKVLNGVRGVYHSGLTREALVLLVHDRVGFTKKHRVKPSPEVVGMVLDALGRLEEFLVEP